MKNFEELLKSCCKNDEAFQKIKKVFTELDKEKNSAKQNLKLLERAVKSDYDSILITTLEMEKPGPKIVYVNDGFTKMTGYSREEVIGKTPRILQGPKTDRAVLDKLKQRLKDGQAFFGHTVNYRKDGSEFINQWDIHPLTDENGEITHWVSYQHDITERKRSEQKLVDTQIEFDKLEEESKKTLVDVDEQGNIITSNKAFRDLIGYDAEELKQLKMWDCLTDKHVETFKHKFEKFKPSDFDGRDFDIELLNKRDIPVEVSAKTRLLKTSDQMIARIAFENRSLQKRIMSMLSKRNATFEKTFDRSTDFNYKLVKDEAGVFKFEYVSESFVKVTGITSSEVKRIPFDELIHPDDMQKVNSHFDTVLQGKPNTEQFRLKNKVGKYVEVIDYAKPEWDSENTGVEAIKGAVSTEISSEAKSNS